MLKKFLYIFLKSIAIVILLITISFAFLYFYGELILGIGPFKGTPVKHPSQNPSQVFPIWSNKTLKVFNRKTKSPIVCLDDKEKLKWCIEVHEETKDNIGPIVFNSYNTFFFITPKIYAHGSCSEGSASIIFHITPDGELKNYYYML